MKDFLATLFLSLAIVGGCAFFAYLLATALSNSNDLSGIGECVESNAYLEGFQGTSKEKWDTFAEYCKLNK